MKLGMESPNRNILGRASTKLKPPESGGLLDDDHPLKNL